MNTAQKIEMATHREHSPWTVNGDLIAPPAVGRVAQLTGGTPPYSHATQHVAPQAANDNLPPVIALTGLAGAGKSTVAAMLIERGYTLVKFAGPLKAMCRAIGLTDRHIEGDLKEVATAYLCGKTPREFMQLLGTQFGRKMIGDSFWTSRWHDAIRTHKLVVVDDCRFPNEEHAVRLWSGKIWRIEGRGGIAGNHESESYVLPADRVINNTGDMNSLRQDVNYGLGVVN